MNFTTYLHVPSDRIAMIFKFGMEYYISVVISWWSKEAWLFSPFFWVKDVNYMCAYLFYFRMNEAKIWEWMKPRYSNIAWRFMIIIHWLTLFVLFFSKCPAWCTVHCYNQLRSIHRWLSLIHIFSFLYGFHWCHGIVHKVTGISQFRISNN